MARNGLYPPIIDTYMPAFTGNSCKVYFSLSSYNSLNEINQNQVQVSITYQNTNESALDKDMFVGNLFVTGMETDETRAGDDKYYIIINSEWLQDKQFNLNTYYKVQIRFTSGTGLPRNDTQLNNAAGPTLTLINQYLDSYSEWSTVCLIRRISTPILLLDNYDNQADSTTILDSTVEISGKLSFENSKEKDSLSSYQIKLFDENNSLLDNSGIQYVNQYNDINKIYHKLLYQLKEDSLYHLEISITTKNLYQQTYYFSFDTVANSGYTIPATLQVKEDNENGRMIVTIVPNDEMSSFTGNVIIRRTSSENNFQYWEDVKYLLFLNESLESVFYDYSIESGIWYKYGIQRIDTRGRRGEMQIANGPFMSVFNHSFLIADGLQLKLKYNPSLSSFKRNVSDVKTDTLGSKYPFIKRNGHMDYKQFQLSGTISYLMDGRYSDTPNSDSILRETEENKLTTYFKIDKDNSNEFTFKSKKDIYLTNNIADLYSQYNRNNNIALHEDINYEKDFRKVVMDFLYKNNIKLFRSATEGNVLVKLMDISLTPESQLNRHIYSFSCTAYEIGEPSIKNINKYNIQTVGTWNSEIGYQQEKLGLIEGSYGDFDIVQTVLYNKYQESTNENEVVNENFYLTHLKITMTSDPYYIDLSREIPEIWTGEGKPSNNLYYGYLLKINDNDIVLNKEGIYELKGDDIKITSLVLKNNASAEMQYSAMVTYSENTSSLPIIQQFFRNVGQLYGSFNLFEHFDTIIWNKHYYKGNNWEYKIVAENSSIELDGISIEVPEGTIIYVQHKGQNAASSYVAGETGILTFYDENYPIIDFYFGGIKYLKNSLSDNAFTIDTGAIQNIHEVDINTLSENIVYTFNVPMLNLVEGNEEQVSSVNNPIIDESDFYTADSVTKPYLSAAITYVQETYMLRNGNLYKVTLNADESEAVLQCPIEGLIDYYYILEKGKYE